MERTDIDTPDVRYEARAEKHRAAGEHARRTADRLSLLRLAAAVALIAAIAWAGRADASWALAAPIAGAAAFALLVRAHGRARRVQRAHEIRQTVCLRGAARVRRAWSALPEPVWARDASAHRLALAGDLHLAGRGSVAQLLDVVIPAVGGARMYEWLVADPPSAATIRARQDAVRALAVREAFLEDCAAAATAASRVPRRSLDAFVAWAESTPARPLGTAARGVAWSGGVLVVAILVAAAAGVGDVAVPLATVLLLNGAIAATVGRRLRAMLDGVGDLPALLRPVLAVAERMDAEPAAAAAWSDVRDRLHGGGGLAAMRALTSLLRWSEVRYSPMGHWALNALMQWDVHLLARLDAWRRASGGAARAWFDAVGDGEALTALATLSHDNPGWVIPTLDDAMGASGTALDAVDVGHPLLPERSRVGNPLTLGGPGSLLVVSGSNMAGKTTLLRAAGVNVLLAQAGGPACASAMRWRRLRVRTSIHVHDALEDGVSLYLAELRRLKSIVDDAGGGGVTGNGGDAPVLYLLDEVLHGTNSADRRTATRAILARLRRSGATGIITTHDLELADDPALHAGTMHRHFREQYAATPDGPRMTFDFVARPGRATSANALALLAALGLE